MEKIYEKDISEMYCTNRYYGVFAFMNGHSFSIEKIYWYVWIFYI